MTFQGGFSVSSS